ncbi:MAG: rod shape-determining protein MreC [Eubacteriales bacterium]|nr:rod shape-determining protein MreC [Eubacteriales bacterium]
MDLRKIWRKIVHRRWFPAAVIAVIACLVLAVFTGASGQDSIVSRTLGNALLPAERAITHAAVRAADSYNKYFKYDELAEENEALKQQVADLTAQLDEAQSALSENKELKDMLGVAERNTEFSYEAAEVVGRTLDEWSSALTIDAGSAEGLEQYDCVVTAKGMVGYISELSEHSAQVTTVIDSNMSAGALMTRTGVVGVAEGNYQLMSDGKLQVSYLSKDADIVVGDTVQTSGTGGLFPKGLTIGTVESVQTESDGMSNYAVIAPAVDLSSLTHVYIITEITTTSE